MVTWIINRKCLLDGDGGRVVRVRLGHDATEGLDTKGKRSNIKEENVGDVASQRPTPPWNRG